MAMDMWPMGFLFFLIQSLLISPWYDAEGELLYTSNNDVCCMFIWGCVTFYLDSVENTIYNDDGEDFKFTMLNSTLVKHFPQQKLDYLKFLIKSKCLYH